VFTQLTCLFVLGEGLNPDSCNFFKKLEIFNNRVNKIFKNVDKFF
jgi:hypothetical protein